MIETFRWFDAQNGEKSRGESWTFGIVGWWKEGQKEGRSSGSEEVK